MDVREDGLEVPVARETPDVLQGRLFGKLGRVLLAE